MCSTSTLDKTEVREENPRSWRRNRGVRDRVMVGFQAEFGPDVWELRKNILGEKNFGRLFIVLRAFRNEFTSCIWSCIAKVMKV